MAAGGLAQSQTSLALSENLDVVQRILNSVLMQYYISKTSVSIAGGYVCFQKNFIERFSIPRLSIRQINMLRSIQDNQELDEYLIKLYQLNLSGIGNLPKSEPSLV